MRFCKNSGLGNGLGKSRRPVFFFVKLVPSVSIYNFSFEHAQNMDWISLGRLLEKTTADELCT